MRELDVLAKEIAEMSDEEFKANVDKLIKMMNQLVSAETEVKQKIFTK